jgi:hypothetical protein
LGDGRSSDRCREEYANMKRFLVAGNTFHSAASELMRRDAPRAEEKFAGLPGGSAGLIRLNRVF